MTASEVIRKITKIENKVDLIFRLSKNETTARKKLLKTLNEEFPNYVSDDITIENVAEFRSGFASQGLVDYQYHHKFISALVEEYPELEI